MPETLLGDRIKNALSAIGVTEEAVAEWLGAPCGCSERADKFNALDLWARRTLRKGASGAKKFLDRIIGKE